MKAIRAICFASGFAQAILFYALITNAEAVIGSFGLPTTDVVGFLGRRAAMLFLGLSFLSFYIGASKSIRFPALLLLAVPWLALAGLGTFEYLRGFVGPAIFPAIATELVLGGLLLGGGVVLWWRDVRD